LDWLRIVFNLNNENHLRYRFLGGSCERALALLAVGLGIPSAPLLAAGPRLTAGPAPAAAVRADTVPLVRVERLGFVMGTELRVVVVHRARAAALDGAERSLRELERLDALLTTWDPASPMSALNRGPVDTPVAAPAEVTAVLAEAFAWADRVGGAFSPTVGPLIDAWGIRRGGARPDAELIAAALAASGRHVFELAPGTVTRRHPGAWIDTGAFGKGAALRSAGDTLRAHGVGSALLDLGGQILALGRDGDTGAPWRVAVAHPARRLEPVLELFVEDVSVATSGNSERAGAVDGEPTGHLLDPRTGFPAPIWGSVTVVATDALAADALSTALYVMGPQAGLSWARAQGDVAALFLIERDGALEACWTAELERWLGGTVETARAERGRSCS
jgi:thiamine biosynthesis lipoprotein